MQFWIGLVAGILVGVVVADLTISRLLRQVLPYYLSQRAWGELDGILSSGLRSVLRLRPHGKED